MEQRSLEPRDLRPSASPISAKPGSVESHHRQALYNALVWQDTRGGDYIRILARGGGPTVFAPRRAALATYFSGLKIRWVLDHVAGTCAGGSGRRIVRQHRHVPGLASHGRSQGGLHVTDCTNASRTQLMNCGRWIGIRSCWRHSTSHGRSCRKSVPAANRMAWPAGGVKGVPVAGILGDQQPLAGQACFQAARRRTRTAPGVSCS